MAKQRCDLARRREDSDSVCSTELKSWMDSPLVEALLDMGHERRHVRQAIENGLHHFGDCIGLFVMLHTFLFKKFIYLKFFLRRLSIAIHGRGEMLFLFEAPSA